MERVVRIELTFPAWKAGVLPIYDTRTYSLSYIPNVIGAKNGIWTRSLHLGKVALYRWVISAHFGADEESRTLTPLGARS